MSSNTKIIIAIIAASVIILGGAVWLLSSSGQKEQTKLEKPLAGELQQDEGAAHIPNNQTAEYKTNPPTSGPHYAESANAGIYGQAPADGNLIHSMEHGAVIVWYKPQDAAQPAEGTESAKTKGLSKEEVDKLKEIFSSQAVSKKIMVPRPNLEEAPIALTSWGRLLRLQGVDEGQIRTFMETNENRGPEKAPL